MGIPVEYIPFAEVNDAWSKADRDRSAEIVRGWQKSALEIVGVDFDTLLTSAANSGMKRGFRKHQMQY